MLFTSIPARPNTTPSELFKQYSNSTDVPCKIGEVRIFAQPYPFNPGFTLLSATLPIAAYAAFSGKPRNISTATGGINKVPPCVGTMEWLPSIHSMFPKIKVGTRFEKALTPDGEAQLSSIGFSRQSGYGTRPFYLGVLNDPKDVRTLTALNCEINSQLPVTVTSVEGFISFRFILNALVNHIFAVQRPASSSKRDLEHFSFAEGGDVLNPVTIKSRRHPIIITGHSSKLQGIVMPYFHGLILPDHDTPLSWINSMLIRNMGDNPEDCTDVARQVARSWRLTASTQGGLMLSHLLFCHRMALDAGASISLIRDGSGLYAGSFLNGKIAICKGPTIHKAMSGEDLKSEFSYLIQHSSALKELADFLAVHPSLPKTLKHIDLSGDDLTPRRIHNILRQFKFTTADQALLAKILSRITFRQTYFSPTDPDHLEIAFKAILRDEFLDDYAPILFSSISIMISKDPVLSTLSSFGSTVPVISYSGAEKNLSLVSHEEDQNVFDKTGVKVPNSRKSAVPIYMVGINNGVSIWKEMLRKKQISYKTERRGPDLVFGYKAIALMDGNFSKLLSQELQRRFARDLINRPEENKGEKRKRLEEDLGDEADNKKKVKTLLSSFSAMLDADLVDFDDHESVEMAE